ncbi:MAG: zinc metalloprotease HtpX [Arcobacteraceae bacterium]|jgi:heat shock protein HtpX
MEVIKTTVLLVLLSVLLVSLGGYFGGANGTLIALLLVGGMNFYAYYYSDKHVLNHYKAVELTDTRHFVYQMVRDLAYKANLPMPKVYIIPQNIPNAFATGRNPQNGVVAVTQGLIDLLNPEEVKSVIAHELAHIRHYDILTGTIAATIAGAISAIANMMQFGAMFGGNNQERGGHPIIMLLLAIILPIAAMIIQMTVSRTREYAADEAAAKLVGTPVHLQNALQKLDNYARRGDLRDATQETAHMFIINPFAGHDISFRELFSTHPSTKNRIERLSKVRV